MLKYLKSQRGH